MKLFYGLSKLKEWWASAVSGDRTDEPIQRQDSLSADDPVDESSMESFPSSDPPSWTPARGVSTRESNESRV